MKPHLLFWSACVLGALLDLASKHAVFRALEFPKSRHSTLIPGILDLRCTTNSGGVFGILQGSGFVFIPLSLIALGVVYWFFHTTRQQGPRITVPLGLITAGTLGNLWDRMFYGDRLFHGRVRDFLDFHVGSFTWPTFNLADTFICAGSAALIWFFSAGRPDGFRKGEAE
ncbi:MAG: signal peptidase II [Planctomycetes bacterium]|nr:signal peptidase II [Planctomycetota bacterium]